MGDLTKRKLEKLTKEDLEKFLLRYNIKGKTLSELLPKIAVEFHKRYVRLQPTYAPYMSGGSVKPQFADLVDKLIASYEFENDLDLIVRSYYDNLVEVLDLKKEIRILNSIRFPEEKDEKNGDDKEESFATNKLKLKNIIVENAPKVTLCKFHDNKSDIESLAYFENGNLIIDYWILGESYEDEYFITIQKSNFEQLYRGFEMKGKNKSDLLSTISNAFNGVDCFTNAKSFLELKKIPFEYSVRHEN